MIFSNRIRVFWWSEKIIQAKTKENYGDVLGKYLVEKMAKKQVVVACFKKFTFLDWFFPIYITFGYRFPLLNLAKFDFKYHLVFRL